MDGSCIPFPDTEEEGLAWSRKHMDAHRRFICLENSEQQVDVCVARQHARQRKGQTKPALLTCIPASHAPACRRRPSALEQYTTCGQQAPRLQRPAAACGSHDEPHMQLGGVFCGIHGVAACALSSGPSSAISDRGSCRSSARCFSRQCSAKKEECISRA